MSIIEYYATADKTAYKNFNIHKEKDLILLKELEFIVKLLNEYNLKFFITGTLGLFLHFHKIHREFRDIDLLVVNKYFLFLNALKKDYQLYNLFGDDSQKEILDKIKKNKMHILYLSSIKNNSRLDLISFDYHRRILNEKNHFVPELYKKNYTKQFEGIEYPYVIVPKNHLDMCSRKEDNEDILFYNLPLS
jgi:hypothetical protein